MLPARNRSSAAGAAGSLTSMLGLVYGPELRPSGDCSKPAPSPNSDAACSIASLERTISCAVALLRQYKPLGARLARSDILRGCNCTCHGSGKHPGAARARSGRFDAGFGRQRHRRAQEHARAWGASAVEGITRCRGTRVGISPARARTTDESARAGPDDVPQDESGDSAGPAMLTAATWRRRTYRSSRLHNHTAAASRGPYARRPHAPSWKPPNISGRLIAANLREQSISLLFVFRTRLAQLNATIRAGFDASAFAVPHAPGAVIKPIYGGRASTSSMRCPAMLSWCGIKANTRCTAFACPRLSIRRSGYDTHRTPPGVGAGST